MVAAGLATPCPAISGADPCTGSYNPKLSPRMDADGNTISTTYAKKTDISGMVKSVNGTKPDANGNVAIDNGGTGSVYWKELDINNVRSVNYTDDGESGDIVDPTQLLFIGGKALVASTITQKDNTLFLGNIRTEGSLVPEEVTNAVQGDFAGNFNFVNDKPLAEKSSTGIYPYTNHLDKPLSQIATFKYGEWYRFGLQFQRSTGEWTEPVWIGDKQNDKAINNAQDTLGSLTNTLTQAKFNLSSDSIATLRKYYKKVRPVVVYPSPADRTIICQGVLNPTMFNVADRISNSPFAQSSWFFRPNAPVQVSNYTPTPPTASSKYYLLLVTNQKPSKTNINLIISKNYGAYGVELYVACLLIYWGLSFLIEQAFLRMEAYLGRGRLKA